MRKLLYSMVGCLAVMQAAACVGGNSAFDPTSVTTNNGNNILQPPSPTPTPTPTASHGPDSNNVQGNATPWVTIDLKGCYQSDYTAQVTLGDGQSYAMRIDTGSTTLAVAATACTNCSGLTPTYSPGAGAVDMQSTASTTYGDGSGWTAEVYRDTVSLGGGMKDVPMAFGAIDKQKKATFGHYFFGASYCSGTANGNSAQGIIGFAGKTLANPHTDTFMDVVHTTNNLADVFAVQICDQGGHLWIGGYDPAAVSATPRYTAVNSVTGFYYVDLQDMLLGGTPVGLPASDYGAAMADTGTSVMVLPTTVFDALSNTLDKNAAFVANFGKGFLANAGCTATAPSASRDAIDSALPKLGLQFLDEQGQPWTVDLPATDSYLMAQELPDGTVGYCVGAASGGTSSGLILGNAMMHSQVTIFDRAKNRLGLAPQVGCPRL